MTGIVVRPLRVADKASWRNLWARYNAFYGREGATALPDEIVETTWDRLLNADEPVHGLAAEVDGALVGLAHFLFHRNLIRLADTCYLQDLFTDESARGFGVGRGLIEAVARACREHGVGDMYWHTHQGNTAARALYDRIALNTEFLVYRRAVD